MKRSIRFRFFLWLGAQTVIIFLAIGVVVLAFNLNEQHEHPELRTEEVEESLVLFGAMILLFPLALGSAWIISRRLLVPWRRMVIQAERISAGHLEERIEVPDSRDEVGRLAHTLNTGFDRYQDLLDRLNRFSFNASHQLRNPLASIRTSGEVCLRQPRTIAEYQSVMGSMLEDAQRLNRTIEHILLLARAEPGNLEENSRDVCLLAVAKEAVDEANAAGELRNIRISLDADDKTSALRCVPDLIREALANLLDNAVRFSPENGRIHVSIATRPGNRLRVSVEDSGAGLSAKRKAMIFRPFSRNPDAGTESVGLGLSIVADICRAHSGSVGVDDRAGGGSIFWMEFPASRRPQDEASVQPSE
ncbi:MAG: HAMP domain-containing sensor histidine kinase [Opitutaceae bacterium]